MAEYQEILTQENMSDEDKTKSCDSCSFRGVQNPADKYCPVCTEYLCLSCEEIHRSFKATRQHELVQIGETPGALVRTKSPVTKVMMCDIHSNESVAEFCETHNKVICRSCKLTKHRHCDTEDLRKAAKERKHSFKECFEDVEILASEFENIECFRQSDKMHILQISKDLRQEVKNIKQDIISWASTLERDALKQIDETEHALVSNINSHIAVVEEMKGQLRMAKASLEKIDSDCLVENFILVTKAKQQILDGSEVKQEIEKEIKPVVFNFRKSERLSKYQSEISSFGTLETEETCLIDFQQISRVTKKTDVAVQSGKITGCAFMPNGQLVICDHTNYRLKVLTSYFKLKSELACDSQIRDVAVLSSDEVIITQLESKVIEVLNVSGAVRKVKSIYVGEHCWGVDYKNDRIYVSCHSNNGNGGNIYVLKLNGERVDKLRFDVGYPCYLAVNNAEDRIIVCTGLKSKVLCIDMGGNMLFTYSDSQIYCSLGLLFDSHDNFMVCGRDSNNVHVVKKDGTKCQILLSSDIGLSCPYALAYRSTDKTLLVGQLATKSLTAFAIDF